MKAADTPRPRDGVLFRELDDGCVLYDPAREKVHSLNVTAGVIWCLIDGSRTVDEIAGEVGTQSGADRASVLRDVLRTVNEFARQGLLE